MMNRTGHIDVPQISYIEGKRRGADDARTVWRRVQSLYGENRADDPAFAERHVQIGGESQQFSSCVFEDM